MKQQSIIKSLALSSIVTMGVTACNPFAADSMDKGYENSAEEATIKTTKAEEAKCGEGKCGGETDKTGEAKCGEGKCGSDAKTADTQ